MSAPLVVLGEVKTCLVPSAVALVREEAAQLLALMPGRAVSWRERPGSVAISPSLAAGVDCATRLHRDGRAPAPVRIVGTVAGRALVTGGRILQSSVYTRIVRSGDRMRQPWSHYLSRKGVTEAIDVVPPDPVRAGTALAEGYHLDRAAGAGEGILDLDAISDRLLVRVRGDSRLDQSPPVQVGVTRLCWSAVIGGSAGPKVTMHLPGERVRSVRLVLREESEIRAAQRFCEELAAHDWLLTVLTETLEQADLFDVLSPQYLDLIEPLVRHFSGLWMPGMHTPKSLRALWKPLQSDPGFTQQWNALRERLHDTIAIATLRAANKDTAPGW
ncbi:MAG: hypothetical protein J2P18_18165 [Nocardia sp.]|nr:hypothetical protein [Nocardia sp.]